jgi:hypothetical protein
LLSCLFRSVLDIWVLLCVYFLPCSVPVSYMSVLLSVPGIWLTGYGVPKSGR